MRVDLQPAYVIHRRPYRDTSVLLDVFTPEHGRVGLVARGVRRPSKKAGKGPLLQPFRPLLLSFSGRAELKTLGAIETAQEAPALAGKRLFSGMYMNELLVRLLHRSDAHPVLFAAYSAALQSLGSDAPVDGVLRRFELDLLEDLGYRLDPGLDGRSGEPVLADRWYRYEPGLGLVSCEPSPGIDEALFTGADLLVMAAGEWGGSVRQAAKQLLRRALAVHLGDKPLRSRELFLTAN